MEFVNLVLNFAIIILVAVIIYVCFFSPEADIDINTCRTKIRKSIKKKCTSNTHSEDILDYNHIRQRKIRRELEVVGAEKNEIREKINKRYSNNMKDRIGEVELIREKEFIISLNYEINKILAELILIKKRNLDINNSTPIEKKEKIHMLSNIITKMEDNNKYIDRFEIKRELVKEYIQNLTT